MHATTAHHHTLRVWSIAWPPCDADDHSSYIINLFAVRRNANAARFSRFWNYSLLMFAYDSITIGHIALFIVLQMDGPYIWPHLQHELANHVQIYGSPNGHLSRYRNRVDNNLMGGLYWCLMGPTDLRSAALRCAQFLQPTGELSLFVLLSYS